MQFENSENALVMSIWCKYLVQQTFYVTTLDKTAYNLLYNNVLEEAPVAQLDRATDF
jgi:hypothetical protein